MAKRIPIPEPLTLAQIAEKILAAAKAIEGNVSDHRQHACTSQLKNCIMALGYRPSETKEKPADTLELAKQFSRCVAAFKGELSDEKLDFATRHGLAVLSNLEAEKSFRDVPGLAEVPPETARA